MAQSGVNLERFRQAVLFLARTPTCFSSCARQETSGGGNHQFCFDRRTYTIKPTSTTCTCPAVRCPLPALSCTLSLSPSISPAFRLPFIQTQLPPHAPLPHDRSSIRQALHDIQAPCLEEEEDEKKGDTPPIPQGQAFSSARSCWWASRRCPCCRRGRSSKRPPPRRKEASIDVSNR